MNSAYGVRTLRSDLLHYLIGLNHEVTVICPIDDPTAEVECKDAQFLNWNLAASGANPLRELLAVFHLAHLLRSVQATVLLSFTPKAVVYSSLAARLAGKKNVFGVFAGLGFLFGREPALSRFFSPLVRTALRLVLRNNRTVFFQNPDDLKRFVGGKIVRPDRAVRLHGSGVDLCRFRPTAPRTRSTETVFLMIARLIVPKGVIDYLRAAQILIDEHLSVRFGLLGPYYEHPMSVDTSLLHQFERPGRIDYLGATDDVRPYLESCDVFVLPSYYGEGTPRSTLEAMAMAKPIITTDSPGCRETVVNGRNGYLVPIRDPLALADTMRRLAADRKLVLRMGLISRRIAETHYDVNMVNEHLWSNILQSLASSTASTDV